MSREVLQGVIFDMDGVLVDSHAVHRTAWRLFLRTMGHEVDEDELDFILDGRKRSDILRHFLGDCDDLELDELGRRKDLVFQTMRLEVAPVPGVVAMVSELHRLGTTLAVATSASRPRATATLSELQLLHCFQAVVTGEDVAVGKPDAAIYRMAQERLGIEPCALLAVEDAISGVRAAVGAGLKCVGIALHESPQNLKAAGAIHVLPNFESLAAQDLAGIFSNSEAARGVAAAGST